ncbi:uncharacterized protein LOC133782434 isoform X2 [Humulus lupulus]|uniref:uncharacterized protein LOC133782434 isoform X2 n=1 Tax=Humulus lupulus TaxID=3486 RepID=UPI002B40C139|nr:uncharacterized protein LOC133782434 isoform X2 [Humulus lupulus]
MDQATQGNNPDASANILVKRKRGRPRKYPKTNAEDSVRIPKIQKMNREENIGTPPGFGGVNGNQPSQVTANNNTINDAMVGKAVSGVIEAVFDAGYLLCVKVANSDTTLRGVVFKPGRYVPISRENDVAPNIQMIRRSEIPLPTERHNARTSGERKEQVNTRRDGTHSHNESPTANQVRKVASSSANHVGSKGNKVPPVASQNAYPDPAATSRVNLVPVALQPSSLSNGLSLVGEPTPPATQSSHLATVKGKQVKQAVHPSSGSISTNQGLIVGSQEVHSQPQTRKMPEEVVQNKDNSYEQPPVDMLDAETKSMKLPGMPFEKLVTEVIKRIETPSQLAETQIVDNKRGDKMSARDEDNTNNKDMALDIEPLQAVQLEDNHHPSPSPKPMEDDRNRKMSRLLEETMTESRVTLIDESASTQLLRGRPSPVTESKDREINDLKQGP